MKSVCAEMMTMITMFMIMMMIMIIIMMMMMMINGDDIAGHTFFM